MSSYHDRLQALRDRASAVAISTRDLDRAAWPDDGTRARFDGVMAYASTVLEATDPELATQMTVTAISNALSPLESQPTLVAGNADAWGEQLLVALADLPVTRGREIEQSVKDVAATFQRSAAQRLSTLQADFDAARDEIVAMRESIRAGTANLEARIDGVTSDVETNVGALQAAFEQTLASYGSQIATEQTTLSQVRTSQAREFEEAELARADAARERLAKADADLTALHSAVGLETEKRVAEIRRMESESAQLVGAIGLAGTAERYAEEVTEQKSSANKWRLATVGLALVAVAGVFGASLEQHPATETFGARLGLSLIFGGIAAYAARQSAYHREREQRARDLQLELTAFSPFIEPLSPDQREEERVIMTRKTFGKTTSSVAQDEEPGPMPLSYLLRRKEKKETA